MGVTASICTYTTRSSSAYAAAPFASAATTVRNRLLHRIARIPRTTASTNTPPSEGTRGKTEPTSASRQRPPTPRQTSATTTTTGAMPRDSEDGHHGILSDKRMFVVMILSQYLQYVIRQGLSQCSLCNDR